MPHNPQMLESVEQLVRRFLAHVANPRELFYNEASLQHELALFLRRELPQDWRLYIERPASSFHKAAKALTKKEIDLAIVDAGRDQVVAIELKCPRQGQYPEQMFKACQDLQFLEELVEAGFNGGLFVMHVQDHLFYEGGSQTGIYAHFRGDVPVCGTILKPTGAPKPAGDRNMSASIRGSYTPVWTPSEGNHRYWVQPVMPPAA